MSRVIDRIRSARSFRQLGEEIRRVEFKNLGTQEIGVVANKLAEVSAPQTSVRVAMLGTHAFEPLPQYLRVRAAASQKAIECWCGPYGQYMQPLSPPAQELIDLNPDIIFLSTQLRSIAPRIADFASLTEQDAELERRKIVEHLVEWAELAAAVTSATVLVANFPRPRYLQFGVADAKRVPSEREFYTRLNLDLSNAFRPHNRFAVLDMDSVVSSFGAETSWTPRGYYLSKQPWRPGLCVAIARELWRHVIATKGWARKCLVLDLDNTLWGGIVGEDGPDSIKVGPGDPEGEAYADFQRTIHSLKARGVLLAVASKNNPEDVAEVFAQRSDMPLRMDDFAVMQVGWDTKVRALETIAATLNIGLESLVFLDDSPGERLMVREALPDVVTPEMPDDPALFATFLRQQAWFERPILTEEDQNKARQYKDQAKRAVQHRAAKDLEQYLAALETCVVIRRAKPKDVPRIHQLFTKTNQFNLTTRRYGIGEIEGFLRSNRHSLHVARSHDRFGDLGQIGLFLLENTDDGFRIDSFLLSCRALGRGIETALMNALKKEVRHAGTDGMLRAEFIPSAKNGHAGEFFAAQGLEVVSVADGGVVKFQAPLAELREVSVPHVRIVRSDVEPPTR